jgi:hypothetical protein
MDLLPAAAAAFHATFSNIGSYAGGSALLSPFYAAAQQGAAALSCFACSSKLGWGRINAAAVNSSGTPAAQQQQQHLPMHSAYVPDDALLLLPIICDDEVFQETDQLLEHLLELPPVQYPQQHQQQQQQDMLQVPACGSCLLNLLLLP